MLRRALARLALALSLSRATALALALALAASGCSPAWRSDRPDGGYDARPSTDAFWPGPSDAGPPPGTDAGAPPTEPGPHSTWPAAPRISCEGVDPASPAWCPLPPSFCADDEWLAYYTAPACADGQCSYTLEFIRCEIFCSWSGCDQSFT